jgi:hypothetical protein
VKFNGPRVARLAVVGVLAAAVWLLSDREMSRRALADHFEKGRAYAAREIEELGPLPAVLRESSGIAVSRTQPGVLWTHNDSGNDPNLYAIDTTGRLIAVIRVTAAVLVDWEDIATGPCPSTVAVEPAGAVSCLYIADIGDNDRVREELTVYIVVEPRLDRSGPKPDEVPAQSFRYRYPGGPDDCEALAVLPNGDVTLVSKGRSGSIHFFRIAGPRAAAAVASGQVLVAEDDGDAGIQPNARIGRLVTGAAVSPDGGTLAVRTYNEVFFYRGADQGEAGTRWQNLGQPCFLGGAEPQGEGIAYLDNETLLLTSETASGRQGTLHRLRC